MLGRLFSGKSTKRVSRPNDAKKFIELYSALIQKLQRRILVFSFTALVTGLTQLVLSVNANQPWRGLIPCTFQVNVVADELQRVANAAGFSAKVLHLAPLLPLIVVLGRNAARGVLSRPLEFPVRLIVGSWFWSAAVIFLIYSTVNVKELTDYDLIVRYSCEVTGYLFFFPPGPAKSIVAVQAEAFRNTSAVYFSNELNQLYPNKYPGLESHLASIDVAHDLSDVDDSSNCDLSSAEANSETYLELYKYIKPLDDDAVLGYCKESTAIATRSRTDSVNETFPMNLLLSHIQDVTAALAVGEGACQFADARVPNTTDPLTSADVCAYFTESTTLDDVPVSHRPYLGGLWRAANATDEDVAFSIMRAKLLPLDTLARQAACVVLLNTLVPSTGWQVFSQQLCPEVIDDAINGVSVTQEMQVGYKLNMIREARYLNHLYDTGMSPLFPSRPAVIRDAIRRALDSGVLDIIAAQPGNEGAKQLVLIIRLFVSPDASEITSLSAAVTSSFVASLTYQLQQQQQQQESSLANLIDAYASAGTALNAYGGLPTQVENFMDNMAEIAEQAGKQITATAERASALAAYTALAGQAKRITAAMASAMLLVRSLVGLVAGVDVAAKLFPFSVSCMTGILKGMTAFKRLARAAAHSGRLHSIA